ncbi:MAG: hypothetical protein WCW65_02930 [Candidatus Paceibacterota bacterium]
MQEKIEIKKEIIIDQIFLTEKVHGFLAESEKYGVKCLDLEKDLISSITNWIENNKLKLAEDFKNFSPKTLPLMRELEKLLENKIDISRIHEGGSTKDFRRIKIVGEWAREIYDSVLISIFKSN